ncbi:MAG: DUF2142 domain-containing protein [Undibacterium sp.]|nr:DUF2142 domain-containing protein [Opitutaceae bacterium]
MEFPENTAAERRGFWSRLQPQRVFLALALPFGLAVLVANPPYQAPDENDHHYRAFQVSDGAFVSTKQDGSAGGNLPLLVHSSTNMGDIPFHSENKMTRERFREKWERPWVDWSTEKRVFVGFPHTVVYPPWAYLPQSLAIGVGRFFHVGPLGLMYLARLAAFVVAIGLGFAALRAVPVFRWSCLVMLLAPMSLYLMGSVAPDGLLIGCAFLLAGILTRYGTGAAGAPDGWAQAGLLGFAAFLGATKLVYLPLVLLVPIFVLPRIAGWRERAAFGAAFGLICLVPLWVWARVVAEVYAVGRTDVRIDPTEQGHYVMGDPVGFAKLMAWSLWEEGNGIYRWFVGTLGWGDTVMPDWFYGAYGWGLAACLLAESAEGHRVRWWQRALIVVAAVATVGMICGAQYATWNALGSRELIEGLSGRYFIPVAAFLIVGFPSLGRLKAPTIYAPLVGTVVATTSAVVCLAAVVARYYLP